MMEDNLALSPASKATKVANTFVVASPERIRQLQADEPNLPREIELIPLHAGQRLQQDALQRAELLVIEVESNNTDSLARIEDIRRFRADLPIIAAVETAELGLMRALLRHGINDIVALPFKPQELLAQIYDTGAASAPSGGGRLAPTICMVGSGGGSGVSSLILHTAAGLVSGLRQARVCVIDFDLQFGDLAAYMGLKSKRSVIDLLEAGRRLDQDMLRDVAIRAENGLYLIPAPDTVSPIEAVDIDQLLNVLTLARTEFDYVLLDLPPAFTNWSLSLAMACNEIVVVTEQTIPALRQARRRIAMFSDVGFAPGNLKIVVNRAQKGRFRKINLQDVADTLGRDVIGSVTLDKGDLADALDRGELLDMSKGRQAFVKEVQALADNILDRLEEDEA